MAQRRRWVFQTTVNIKEDGYTCYFPNNAETISEAIDNAINVVLKDKKRLPDRITLKRNNAYTII